MKSIAVWLCIGLSVVLFAWCNLNTYFINQNTKRIEVLESVEHKYTTDTIFVVHTVDTTYVTYKIQKQNVKKK